MKRLQQYIVKNLVLILVISTMISGCKKESVEPDKMDDKKDDKPVLLSDIQKIEGGGFHTMLLKTDSTLWATGNNEQGQLGTGDNTDRFTFKKVMTDVVDVACGLKFTLVLKKDGSLWVTGSNDYGQLGTGDNVSLNDFTKILDNVIAIDAGSHHSLALKKSNILMVTGFNANGQLGMNNQDDYNTFTGVREAEDIVAGANCSFLINNNELFATGLNANGQLGSFDYENQSYFKKVISGVAEISSGYAYTMALKTNKSFFVSGLSYYGRPGSRSGLEEFTQMPEFNVTSFSSGIYHSLIVSDNSLWGVGVNQAGQLGLENDTNTTFTKIVDGNVSRVFTGYYNSWYIDTEGKLWATGANESGQLGIGDSENRSQFTLVEL